MTLTNGQHICVNAHQTQAFGLNVGAFKLYFLKKIKSSPTGGIWNSMTKGALAGIILISSASSSGTFLKRTIPWITRFMFLEIAASCLVCFVLMFCLHSLQQRFSKCFHKARREFLCAATITESPALIRGTIFSSAHKTCKRWCFLGSSCRYLEFDKFEPCFRHCATAFVSWFCSWRSRQAAFQCGTTRFTVHASDSPPGGRSSGGTSAYLGSQIGWRGS